MRITKIQVPRPLPLALRAALENRRVPHDVFPPAVMEEARRLQIPAFELARRPLVFGFSVDGPNPHEIDDAFSVRKVPEGYEVAVSVADPTSLFLCEGLIDLEARKRGRSLYRPNDTCIPMLPEPLLELASLTPGESRLAFTVIMTFDGSGRRLKVEDYETVFINHRAMDFSEAGLIAQEGCPEDPLVEESLRCGIELARLLRNGRNTLLPAEFGLLDNGALSKPTKLLSKEEATGALIIQELMIAANTAIADFMDGNMTLLFRCHGVKTGMPQLTLIQTELRHLLQKQDFDGITRKMGAWFDIAHYSTLNSGHVGLGLKRYSHCTSPLRRYADMLNHRLLRILLRGGVLSQAEQEALREHLEPIAEAISVNPREVERVVLELNGDLLSAARKRKLSPQELACLIQRAFDDPACMDFVREYFNEYKTNIAYIKILNQLCQLNGWTDMRYIEKNVAPARRGGAPRFIGKFQLLIEGEKKETGTKIYPSGFREKIEQKAAFFFLRSYVNEELKVVT